MYKRKKWKFLISSLLVLLTLSSCEFAKGDYQTGKTKTEGTALVNKEKSGYVVYKIKTEKENQSFSQLSVAFSNSRFYNYYGKNVINVKLSISQNQDFTGEVLETSQDIQVGKKHNNLQFDFNNHSTALKAMKAKELYLKVSIDFGATNQVFERSWVVLGTMKVYGAEVRDGSESTETTNSYLAVDFTSDGLGSSIEHQGLYISENNKLRPSYMGEGGYICYSLATHDASNSFESLTLNVTESILKSYKTTVEDEEGKETEELLNTGLNIYVSGTKGVYPTNPSVSYSSEQDEKNEFTIDLTKAVQIISNPQIYVKIELFGTEDIPNDGTYLEIGKISFVGEESYREDSYLEKSFKEGVSDAVIVHNMAIYNENEAQNRIVLKSKGVCDYYDIEYTPEGEKIEKKSTVCSWQEKGIKYSASVIRGGLTEKQLSIVLTDYGASLDSNGHYEDTKFIGSRDTKITIDKVYDDYWELTYDFSGSLDQGKTDENQLQLLQEEIKKYTFDQSKYYEANGKGNVVLVEHDGRKEVYIHEGTALNRVTDSKKFSR